MRRRKWTIVLTGDPIPRERGGFRFPTVPPKEPALAISRRELPNGAVALIIRDGAMEPSRMVVVSAQAPRQFAEAATFLLWADEGLHDVSERRLLWLDRSGAVKDQTGDLIWEAELEFPETTDDDWAGCPVLGEVLIPELGPVQVIRYN